jgi:phage tail-like protein
MARAAVEDPIKVFRFRANVDGFDRLGFSEISMPPASTEPVKYREGGMNETPQKSAGLTEYEPIVMKRGQLVGSSKGGDLDFIKWYEQVHKVTSNGTAANYRKDFDIEQYDSTNTLVRKWRVINAFPTKFKPASDLNALGNENSFEELTIEHEGIYKQL